MINDSAANMEQFIVTATPFLLGGSTFSSEFGKDGT